MIFVHQNRLSNDFQNYVYLKGATLIKTIPYLLFLFKKAVTEKIPSQPDF